MLLSKFNKNLLQEWDYEKNNKLNIFPDKIAIKSTKKVWWKCNQGHSWQAVIYSRTGKNTTNCPYCAGKKILKGFNDLLTVHPDICKEWDYNKNNIQPDEITKGSHKKVYWKCSKGHSWLAAVYSRTSTNKTGCPYCSNQTSFGEQCIYYYLLPYNATNRFKLNNMEIDIYLPEMNIGIEFNGEYWHKDRKEKDLIKELKLSHKVTMYYICESDKNEIKENKIFFNKENYHLNLEWALKTLFNILNLNIDVNIERDEQLIYKNSVYTKKESSLAYKHPELLKEWDYEKNLISPEQITSRSKKKIYWKCKNNHSWQAVIYSRTSGKNCPYCSGRFVIKGKNDLLSNFPDICKEWDYTKNLISPDQVTSQSAKKVWWKCNKGHSWEAKVYNRTSINKTGCPYCAKKKSMAIQGEK